MTEHKEGKIMDRSRKAYFYLRSKKLHMIKSVDYAVDLSEDEDKRLKEEIAVNPCCKAEALKSFWSFLTKTVGKKAYNFDDYMDSYCSNKRKEMEAKGL